MKPITRASLACAAMLVAACSTTGTSIQIGAAQYQATSPESVVLLAAPPERKHEVIALVEGVAATDDYFTRERTQSAAVAALKKEAARIGAHAVILTGKSSTPYGQVTVGSGVGSGFVTGNMVSSYFTTTSTSLGWEKIIISGQAIRYSDAP